MALARFGIFDGRKVPVSEIPTVRESQLSSFARRALSQLGFLSVAEKLVSERPITLSEIARLVDQAGVPVLMKLVKVATNNRTNPPSFDSSLSAQDFYKVGPKLDELVSDAWCQELKDRGVRRVELPLSLGAVERLLDSGFEVDLVSNFDAKFSHEALVREFEQLDYLVNRYFGIKSWMPVLTSESRQYQDQGARDFQLLRFIAIGKVICREKVNVRIASPTISREARPLTRLAGVCEFVDYSPVDPIDGEIFIRTLGFKLSGNNTGI
jgi:hypothetical protein